MAAIYLADDDQSLYDSKVRGEAYKILPGALSAGW